MPWRGPSFDGEFPSLGWELLEWFEVLPSPRDATEPLRFTDEQALQLVEWFAIDPQRNDFVYRRGFSRRSKGWGKSPVEAAKVIAELAGPVRFDGWDADGEPVGRPWGGPGDPQPWVQVGAVSEDQTDNTWSVVYYFLTENDGAAADELGIDAGLTRCFLRNRPGAKLEPVTASAGSREGQPITYACLDETHLWMPQNHGVRLARTLRRNVSKMNGRSYETTNSFVRGTKSVAEGSHKAVLNGAAGVFSDEVEAPTAIDGVGIDLDSSDEHLRAALRVAYGDSWWADVDRIVADIRDPDSDWEESCRFFFNWNRAAPEQSPEARIPLTVWDELGRTPRGYDRSTARLAIDVAHDRRWAAIGVAGERDDDKTELALVEGHDGTDWVVNSVARHLGVLGSDVVTLHKGSPAESLTESLEAKGFTVDVMTTGELANATQRFIDASLGTNPTIRHRGEPQLRTALSLAQTKPHGDGGEVFSRRSSSGNICELMCVLMAFGRLGAEPKTKPRKVAGKVW